MRLGRRRAAARYLRLLATLENLVEHDQISEARRTLASVDPLEARELAATLERGSEAERGTGRAMRLLSSPTRTEYPLRDALIDIAGYGISPNNGYPVVSADVVKKAKAALNSNPATGTRKPW